MKKNIYAELNTHTAIFWRKIYFKSTRIDQKLFFQKKVYSEQLDYEVLNGKVLLRSFCILTFFIFCFLF